MRKFLGKFQNWVPGAQYSFKKSEFGNTTRKLKRKTSHWTFHGKSFDLVNESQNILWTIIGYHNIELMKVNRIYLKDLEVYLEIFSQI